MPLWQPTKAKLTAAMAGKVVRLTREKNINGEENSKEWENKCEKFPPCPDYKKTDQLEKHC